MVSTNKHMSAFLFTMRVISFLAPTYCTIPNSELDEPRSNDLTTWIEEALSKQLLGMELVWKLRCIFIGKSESHGAGRHLCGLRNMWAAF